jgi:hypothetical protein
MSLVNVCHPAQPKMIACMIEDDELVLSLSRAQTPANFLNKLNSRPAWLRVNNAAHVGVEARRQDTDADKDLRDASLEPRENISPGFSVRIGVAAVVALRRISVDIFGRDACLTKTLPDVLRVPPIDAEAYRRQAPAGASSTL